MKEEGRRASARRFHELCSVALVAGLSLFAACERQAAPTTAARPASGAASAPAGASEPTAAAPDAAAAVLPADHPFAVCAACHGAEGEGSRELLAPRLVNQDAAYLRQQIESFRRGWRGGDPRDEPGQRMRAIVTALPPEAMDRAITWVAAQTSERRPDRLLGDRERGEMLFQQSCAVCHGERGEGDPTYHMARLSQQHGWYLAAQLRAYRTGLRGADPKDEFGQTMRFYANLLPDDEAIEDVVAWLVRARRKE